MENHIDLVITKVTILTGVGTDKVLLHTTKPTAIPAVSKQPLGMEFDTVKGGGYDYCVTKLCIKPKLIEIIGIGGNR